MCAMIIDDEGEITFGGDALEGRRSPYVTFNSFKTKNKR